MGIGFRLLILLADLTNYCAVYIYITLPVHISRVLHLVAKGISTYDYIVLQRGQDGAAEEVEEEGRMGHRVDANSQGYCCRLRQKVHTCVLFTCNSLQPLLLFYLHHMCLYYWFSFILPFTLPELSPNL